jgi:response regulator RpfG family c-di-GMP phosphodiesterase
MMTDESAAHFDPQVLEAFFDHLPEITEIRAEYMSGEAAPQAPPRATPS